MKKQLYIFSLMMVMINNVTAFNELTVFDETNEESNWMFIEKKFITDIHAEKKSFWTHLSTIIPAAAIAFSGYQYFQITNDNENKDFIQTLLKPQNIYSITSLAATSLLITQYLECKLSAQANRNAVENFFNNWDQNQFYIPEELEEAFDAIAETIELQGQEAVLEHADEIVDAIQFITTRKLSSRYSKSLEITACNALGNAKTIGEILKNAVETGSKLAGGK